MTAVAFDRINTDLPVDIIRTADSLTVRWEGREFTLQGSEADLRRCAEALRFCYRTGVEDASNPRLFVP